MKRVFTVVFFLFFSLSIVVSAGNACDQLDYWSTDDITLAISTKLARGVTNTATGWMEFPRAFYVTGKSDGIAKSIVMGPFQGIFLTVVRTLTGIFEVGTFFIPAPGCYDPVMDRPLVWSDVHQQEGVLIFNKEIRDEKYKKQPGTLEEGQEGQYYESTDDEDVKGNEELDEDKDELKEDMEE